MKYKLSLISLGITFLLLTNMPYLPTIDAQTWNLYGVAYKGSDGLATLYSINPATGAATPIGPIGFERVSAMDAHPMTGVLYATGERADGSDTHVLMIIHPSGGREVGPTGVEFLGFGDTVSDISFRNSDNKLYAYLDQGDGVGTINIATGVTTALGPSTVECCGNGIAFSTGDTLYHSNQENLHTLNQNNGAAAVVAPMGFSPPADNNPRINAMDFHPGTGVLYASLNDKGRRSRLYENYLATVDTSTGAVTIIGRTVDGLDAIAFVPDTPVGGVVVSVNKFVVLTPYIALAGLIIAV